MSTILKPKWNGIVWNFSQHKMTKDQIADGGKELSDNVAKEVKQLLLFTEPPTKEEIQTRLETLRKIISENTEIGDGILISSAAYFLYPAIRTIIALNRIPIASFTKREAIETEQPDGTVKLSYTFKHIKWVIIE